MKIVWVLFVAWGNSGNFAAYPWTYPTQAECEKAIERIEVHVHGAPFDAECRPTPIPNKSK